MLMCNVHYKTQWIALLLVNAVAGCGSAQSPCILARFTGNHAAVVSLAFSPSGEVLASRGEERKVRIWDVGRLRESRQAEEVRTDRGSVAFSPDGDYLAANEATVGVVAWNAKSRQKEHVYRYPDPGAKDQAVGCYSITYGWGVAYAPDGDVLAAGGSHFGEDGTVTVWNSRTGSVVAELGLESPVLSLAVSNNGETIASGCLDGTVVLWDAHSYVKRVVFQGDGAPVWALSFSPESRLLAWACADKTVRTVDCASGQLKFAISTRIDGPIFCLSFHPSRNLIVTGHKDGSIRMWDLAARSEAARLDGHASAVLSLCFSRDGTRLASGSSDGSIVLWDTDQRER